MPVLRHATPTFPSVTLPGPAGAADIEVHLVGQLGPGTGSALVAGAGARQRGHGRFVDALDEPSTRLGGMDLAAGRSSTLFSFTVGPPGHPFHRHAGERVFTAVSGSGGCRLRFCAASDADLAADPEAFVRALRVVDVPPDALFTVRFAGGTWHQFLSADPALGQPALFALSCHPDELGGDLAAEARARVLAGEADIPGLTEVLPEAVQRSLDAADRAGRRVETSVLRLSPSRFGRLGARLRAAVGGLRAALVAWRGPRGAIDAAGEVRAVAPAALPADLLLLEQLPEAGHTDAVVLALPLAGVADLRASRVLEDLLAAFVSHPPRLVGGLMRLRNLLVAPLRLRTSPLGCPVSPLLAVDAPRRFAGRFPVQAARVRAGDRSAEVLLAVEDRHLRFRTSIRVDLDDDGCVRAWLATRVATRNRFGRAYLALIDAVHRRYVAPTLLREAAAVALPWAGADTARRSPRAMR